MGEKDTELQKILITNINITLEGFALTDVQEEIRQATVSYMLNLRKNILMISSKKF
jgi:hypothetical protein